MQYVTLRPVGAPWPPAVPVFNVRDFGASASGVTSDSTAIQAAINAAAAAGGGTVFFPAGTYAIATNLLITANGIHFAGVGAGFGQFASPFSAVPSGGSILKAITGCTIMLAMSAISGASNRSLVGCSVEGLSFDCNSVALIGIALSSVSFSTFRHIFIANATIAGLNTSAVAALNDNRTLTRNHFDDFTVWNAATNGDGMILDGLDDSADFGGNRFGLVQILHKNGVGVHLKNSDSNIFDYTYCNCIGTGIGVVFEGSNTSASQICRSNIFRWLSAGSVTAKGTATYTYGSRDNIIEHLDFESNSIFPTIEAGAGLSWTGNRGFDPGARATVRGDVTITVIPGADTRFQYFDTPLTTNRTVTISGTGINGASLGAGGCWGRVVRSANATGASTLTVTCTGVSRILAVGQWCDWLYDGQVGASVITAFGSL